MKIYDCFMFFAEFEILELRLQELNDSVDYFVLTESNKTHALRPKPLYFKENNHRFEPYRKKIIYIENLDTNKYSGVWSKENADRNSLSRGLVNADQEDIIMISDVDEIPDISNLDLGSVSKPITLDMEYYNYYVNCRKNRWWPGTTLHRFSHGRDPQWYRDNRVEFPRVQNGWHYSYLGGFDRIKEKLRHAPDSIEYRHFDYVSDNSNGELIKKRLDGMQDIFGRGGDQTIRVVDAFEGRKPRSLREWTQKYPYMIRTDL
jgi:beta-1,4-mannosyl-glycoprotein beta-1,4-N-acetylglucosaminyltransferase